MASQKSKRRKVAQSPPGSSSKDIPSSPSYAPHELDGSWHSSGVWGDKLEAVNHLHPPAKTANAGNCGKSINSTDSHTTVSSSVVDVADGDVSDISSTSALVETDTAASSVQPPKDVPPKEVPPKEVPPKEAPPPASAAPAPATSTSSRRGMYRCWNPSCPTPDYTPMIRKISVDGEMRSVCNACGIYYKRHGKFRSEKGGVFAGKKKRKKKPKRKKTQPKRRLSARATAPSKPAKQKTPSETKERTIPADDAPSRGTSPASLPMPLPPLDPFDESNGHCPYNVHPFARSQQSQRDPRQGRPCTPAQLVSMSALVSNASSQRLQAADSTSSLAPSSTVSAPVGTFAVPRGPVGTSGSMVYEAQLPHPLATDSLRPSLRFSTPYKSARSLHGTHAGVKTESVGGSGGGVEHSERARLTPSPAHLNSFLNGVINTPNYDDASPSFLSSVRYADLPRFSPPSPLVPADRLNLSF